MIDKKTFIPRRCTSMYSGDCKRRQKEFGNHTALINIVQIIYISIYWKQRNHRLTNGNCTPPVGG
jgi:hypothetical protein